MTRIRKNVEFSILDGVDLYESTIDYFKQSGFECLDVCSEADELRFIRGSIFLNMFTFNPLKWKSKIDIELHKGNIKAKFEIVTVGQYPTAKDEELWDVFIENYKRYLNDTSFDFLNENSKAIRMIKNKNLNYIGWGILGGIIGSIPSVFIAHWAGIDSIVSVGAVLGAIVFLMMRINQEKKNNTV
jgi:hypothetical protein